MILEKYLTVDHSKLQGKIKFSGHVLIKIQMTTQGIKHINPRADILKKNDDNTWDLYEVKKFYGS